MDIAYLTMVHQIKFYLSSNYRY